MKSVILLFLLFMLSPAWSFVHIVSAETSYAQIAQRLGGEYVQVTPLMTQTNQDPHLFTASTKQAKALAQADIIVFNGAGYDLWINHLLPAIKKENQLVIEVAALLPYKVKNPHIWYDPQTMPLYAHELVAALKKYDPEHAAYFSRQLQQFLQQYQQLQNLIKTLKQNDAGKAVLMTEPLFEPMADTIGLRVLGKGFAKNIMNEAPPTPSEIADFEQVIMQRQAQALIYNKQVISPLIESMKNKASAYQIPLVGISETQPLNQDYIEWMSGQLHSVAEALHGTHRS